MNIRAYECRVKGFDWSGTIHAESAAKAKYRYWRDVSEPWPDVKFTHIRCRLLGAPITDESFAKTAQYRGVPFAKIGMRVQVEGRSGVIVGKNSSANFEVLFDDGPHKGLTLNCHPNWRMKYFDQDGNEIATEQQEPAS